MARLNGVVPTIGINSGYCFAGNAALLGACDVIIATEDSNIGMGGPAMIEGGGLGVFSPDEVGPIDVQLANGVVDIGVRRRGRGRRRGQALPVVTSRARWPSGSAPTSALLRSVVPANRLRTYDIRAVIEGLADTGSVLELRRHFGLGMVTALARIEGQPVGILANNPAHLAGAIDSDGADKAARFMQLLDAFDIPLLVLCDTPGIMVGPGGREDRPRAPLQPAVRHRRQPVDPDVHGRAAQGLRPRRAGDGRRQRDGAVLQPSPGRPASSPAWAWRARSSSATATSWPTSRTRRRAGPLRRPRRRAYEQSKAIHQGVVFGVDDVIDPMDTRRWMANGLRSVARRERPAAARRVDVW